MKSKVEPALRCNAGMNVGGYSYSCFRCLKRMNPHQVRICDWQVMQRIAAVEEDMLTRCRAKIENDEKLWTCELRQEHDGCHESRGGKITWG